MGEIYKTSVSLFLADYYIRCRNFDFYMRLLPKKKYFSRMYVFLIKKIYSVIEKRWDRYKMSLLIKRHNLGT